jgi:hypothetical protein
MILFGTNTSLIFKHTLPSERKKAMKKIENKPIKTFPVALSSLLKKLPMVPT